MKIITSNTSRGAYRGVLKELKINLGGAANNVVLAPDRFTASVERGLISSLDIESSFGIEVMSFTRLAGKLVGNKIKKCLTPEGSVMLISKVITDNRYKLKYYGKVAIKEGFASELYAALTALRNSGISVEAIEANAQHMPAALSAKSKDIALIYSGYLHALEGRHSDSSTRLYALAQYIKEYPQSVAFTHFYCTDIYDFSAPELEILSGLANSALSLTIGVTSGYDNANKRIYPDRIIKKLTSLVADNVEIVRNDEELEPVVSAISTQLFSYEVPKNSVENNGKVTLRRARDRYDEVLRLALDIKDGVRKGKRYRDFEVFVSDISDYEAELKAIFARYEIPFFIDKKELLVEQTKIRYLLDAIACVRSNFGKREVFDLVKNPLFWQRVDGGEDSVFLFENYVLKYNVDHSRFFSEFTLCSQPHYQQNKDFNNAESYDKQSNHTKFEYENSIPEAVRRELVKTLKPINFKDDNDRPVSDFVNACKVICEQAENAWQTHVNRLSELSEYYQKCAEQVDTKIDEVLDEISEVSEDVTDVAGFETILKSMLKTLKIALVPTFLDCVFIGDIDSRFMGGGDVYILGATNGKLPQTTSGGIVLTPKDEELLSRLGLEVVPNERQKVLTNMYAVCDLMKKPHGRIVVSYPEIGESGALRPSTVIAELCGMINENGKRLEVQDIDFSHLYRPAAERYTDNAAELFGTVRGCYHEVLRNAVSGKALKEDALIYGSAYECVDYDNKKKIEKAFDEPERIKEASGSFAERTSVSRLESFYGCPYSHYFHYILALKKRKDGEFEGTENGTILHYVLEKFFTDVHDGKIDSQTQIQEAAYKYFDEAVRENGFEVLLEKPDTRRLLLRVKEEGAKVCCDLYEIYLRSKYKPAMLEAKIGEGDIKPMSLDIDGKKISLKGVIDRIDVCDDKFVVIDYKTYKSADLTLKELYYGQKLQLYVYMEAVRNSLQLTPSGVFYLPIFAGFTGEDCDRYKYKGQVSDDTSVLEALDDMIAQDAAKTVLPYKKDKNGLNQDVHLSKEKFDLLGNYALRLAALGAREISNGYIKPAPVKDRCKKCDYQTICAYRERNERKLSNVTMRSFEEDVENE